MNPRLRLSAGIAVGMLSMGSAARAQTPAGELRDVARRLELTGGRFRPLARGTWRDREH